MRYLCYTQITSKQGGRIVSEVVKPDQLSVYRGYVECVIDWALTLRKHSGNPESQLKVKREWEEEGEQAVHVLAGLYTHFGSTNDRNAARLVEQLFVEANDFLQERESLTDRIARLRATETAFKVLYKSEQRCLALALLHKAALDAGDDDLATETGEKLEQLNDKRQKEWVQRGWKSVVRNRLQFLVAAAVILVLTLGGLIAEQVTRERQRQVVIDELHKIWDGPDLTHSDMDHAQVLLLELQRFGEASADDERVRYIQKLFNKKTPLDVTDLRHIVGAIDRFRSEKRDRTPRLRELGLGTQLDKLTPFTRTSSLYAFIKPDPERLEKLELVVQIEDVLDPQPQRVGAKLELIKAFFAAGNVDKAWEIAQQLLDRPELPEGWRVCLMRDYTWLAIRSGRPERMKAAREQTDGVGWSTGTDPATKYPELLVERARLKAVEGRTIQAQALLTDYLGRVAPGIKKEADDVPGNDTRFVLVGVRENFPVVAYLDAALLQGILYYHANKSIEGEAKQVWGDAFENVRYMIMATSYEAAMLASLSGELDLKDALRMVTRTSADTKTVGPSKILDRAKQLLTAINPISLMSSLPNILKRTWVDDRGLRFASDIALRKMGFDEYINVQIRLWFYQGLRRFGWGDDIISPDLDALLWKLVNDTYKAYAENVLTEEQIVELAEFLLMKGSKSHQEWPAKNAFLPDEIKGPFAYVIGHIYLRDKQKAVAEAYFRHAYNSAQSGTPLLELLKKEHHVPKPK
jgi:hypothetical protein